MCSCIVVAAAKSAENIRYFCKVYYEEKQPKLQWQVMFTVVKDLNVLREVLCHILHVCVVILITAVC